MHCLVSSEASSRRFTTFRLAQVSAGRYRKLFFGFSHSSGAHPKELPSANNSASDVSDTVSVATLSTLFEESDVSDKVSVATLSTLFEEQREFFVLRLLHRSHCV